jgi:hypothetical protein
MGLAAYLFGTVVIALALFVGGLVWLRRKFDRIHDGLE